MSTISSRSFYYDGEGANQQIRKALIPNLNLNGLTYDPGRYQTDDYKFINYFSGGTGLNKIEDKYICEEYWGLCNSI